MRIAVIGAGVAGLYAAWRLAPRHDVTVFEAGGHAGGHTNTVDVEHAGRSWAVDTGFIVFNDWTYPNFIAMLEELGVAWQPSNMSFSLRCERTGLEYNGTSRSAATSCGRLSCAWLPTCCVSIQGPRRSSGPATSR
jgi:predicted NAD/FAD-binding protein